MSAGLITWSRGAGLLSLLLFGSIYAPDARAAAGSVLVNARCEPAPAPGRVQCEVEVEVDKGRLPWADLVVRQVPAFAQPLRVRVGPGEGTRASPRRLRLPLSLVATSVGRGMMTLSVRSVRCVPTGETETCQSAEQTVNVEVAVGPRTGGTRW